MKRTEYKIGGVYASEGITPDQSKAQIEEIRGVTPANPNPAEKFTGYYDLETTGTNSLKNY